MAIYLRYAGILTANGDRREKHKIRQAFHKQLLDACRHKPFSQLDASPQHQHTIGSFSFLPFARKNMTNVDLDILCLRPGEPGSPLYSRPDVDNQLKTLLDALRMPENEQEIEGEQPGTNEAPFYCLLENDSLITSLSIHVERLYAPDASPPPQAYVFLTLRVRFIDVGWYWGRPPGLFSG